MDSAPDSLGGPQILTSDAGIVTTPRPTNEVPLYWRKCDNDHGTEALEFGKLLEASKSSSALVDLSAVEPERIEPDGTHLARVRKATIDVSGPSLTPRGVEDMDLHSLVDLHRQFDAEREAMPGELVVHGRVSGLAATMLVDTGASLSVVSTQLWTEIHRTHPGWTLLPTRCRVRTVSGELAKVRGSLVVELELNSKYYVHQFIVMDVQEDLILGLDFIQKYKLNWDSERSVLVLRGEEIPAVRRCVMGDKRVRRLYLTEAAVIAPRQMIVVDAYIQDRDSRDLPDWGVVSPIKRPVGKYGVMAGSALIDPKSDRIPVPVINPGDKPVILPQNMSIGLCRPVLVVSQAPQEGEADVKQQTEKNERKPPPKVRTTPQTSMPTELVTRQPKPLVTTGDQLPVRPVRKTRSGSNDGDVSAPDGTMTQIKLEERVPFSKVEAQGSDPLGAAMPPSDDSEITAPIDRGLFSRKHWSGFSDTESESDGEPVVVPNQEEGPVPSHLIKLYQHSAASLNPEECKRLAEFLQNNADVFARSSDDLGRTNLVQHVIDTGKARPIKQPPRRVPVHKKHLVTEEVDSMLRRGVVEPCEGPWSSPIVLVTKKDGTTRFCVDYRRLNDETRKDAYPLPRIEDNLDALQGSKYYSTLDLLSGYWQVEVAPEDRDKTAFSVGGGGLYRFLTMPFGLCNAPATFQRLMENVLQGLQWEIAVLYIDDVVVFADSVDEHLERLGVVLDRLRRAGLKLKPSKCQLLSRKVEFLGHIVSEDGIEVDPSKVIKIKNWSEPRTLRQVRSFVGLCAYYRRFVPDFSTLCKPLYMLTEKGQPFIWGQAQKEAMAEMKRLLVSAPILAYPKPEGMFILDCDASGVGIGAVLSQVQDGEEKVISYGSKVLNKAQRSYCVTRRELLAIVEFVKVYHHYLYGAKFLCRTDHAALYWLLRKKHPEGQMARWIALLQVYDMVIQHRPGVKHGNADALSRCMEGCRDTDSMEIPQGEKKTLGQIRAQAQPETCRVTTRSHSRQQDQKTPTSSSKGSTKEKGADTRTGVSQKGTTKPSLVKVPPGTPRPSTAKVSSRLTKPGLVKVPSGTAKPRSAKMTSKPTKQSLVKVPSGPLSAKVSTKRESSESNETSDFREHDPGSHTPSNDDTGERPESPPLAASRPTDYDKTDPDSPPLATPDYPPRMRPADGQTAQEMADLQRQEQFVKRKIPMDWSDEAIARLQELDVNVQKVREWCREGKRPTWEEVAKENLVVKSWWSRFQQLMLSDNGVLYIRWEAKRPRDPPSYRVVTPISMFGSVLSELHDAKTAGHLGQQKTVERLKSSRFYWPGMSTFALRWVSNCPVCAKRKHPQYHKRTPLQSYRVGSTLDRISIDLCGPFHPRTRLGNSLILTITDHYTRWIEAYPLKDGTARGIAKCVVQFVCRLGMPLEIHSDQGRNVDGKILEEVCELLGIRKTHTTSFHPRGNAITERENAVIKAMMAAFVNHRLNDWDEFLDPLMLAYRSSVHRTLGTTPAEMMLIRHLRLPLDAFVSSPPEAYYEQASASEYVQNLTDAMAEAYEVVSEQVASQMRYQKRNYDRKVKAQNLVPGQAVWLRIFPHLKGKSSSLMSRYSGPWLITQKLSDVNFRVQKSRKSRTPVVHSDRLKPCYSPVTDEWAVKNWRRVNPPPGKR
jgi:hypothetical protein